MMQPQKVMREIDHLEKDAYGFQVIVLTCGHRFHAHQTGGKPTAKQHRRLQWCTECSEEATRGLLG